MMLELASREAVSTLDLDHPLLEYGRVSSAPCLPDLLSSVHLTARWDIQVPDPGDPRSCTGAGSTDKLTACTFTEHFRTCPFWNK
jgi:hypothetical protein